MRPWLLAAMCFIGLATTAAGAPGSDRTIDLSGEWDFRLDSTDVGLKENWAAAAMSAKIHLPGSLQAQGFGDEVSVNTPWVASMNDRSWYADERYARYREPGKAKVTFWLTPAKHYVGAAWYRHHVEVPADWADRRIVLRLERCHWATTLFIDGKEIGTRDSLTTAHEYDVTDAMGPGKHAIALRVDNSMIVDVGKNAHSVTDHTQTDWNGVIGRLELVSGPRAWVDDVQVYPDVRGARVRVEATVRDAMGKPLKANVVVRVRPKTQGGATAEGRVAVELLGNEARVRVEVQLGKDVRLWDEFEPNLYTAEVTLDAGRESDIKAVTFGMRQLGQEGTQFTINGRRIFVRGTLECCSFPLTGYPATDVAEWKRIIGVCKSYGLNAIRFHSWCPPEAAFDAADELGFYFQVEGPAWANVDDEKFQAYDRAECDRMLRAYGNHPSLCFLTYGNEPSGKKQKEYLASLVEHWKSTDPRHKYSSGSGWPLLEVNEFQMTPEPRVQRWGEGLKSRINALPPATTADYSDFIAKWSAPVVSHEVGQWCVYPDFKEIAKYTGFLKAGNFEIVRDGLAEHHMLEQAEDFLRASGKLQVLCYKEDIESALRTPGFAGFQLLGLQDFPGQGTALVGVLSVFWQDKGYVTGSEFRRFCSETMPLAVMAKRVFTSGENFEAVVRVAHFGPRAIQNAKPVWVLKEGERVVASGSLPVRDVPVGNELVLGKVVVPLRSVAKAAKLTFVVSLEGTPYANDWDVWVYPPATGEPATGDVKVTRDPEEATRLLSGGGKVLLALPAGRVKDDAKLGPVALGFSSIFWNTAWTRRQPPHTLGVLCDPRHPALADFPTEDHTNWQWWYLVHGTRPMILDGLATELKPVVQVIDDWVTNRKLALAFEAKVGRGRLLMTTIDLDAGAMTNPVARQFRTSVMRYMNSDAFAPRVELTAEQVVGLTKPLSMYQKLGATIRASSEQPGNEAANLLESDSTQIWHSQWKEPKAAYPHELVIELGRPVLIRGIKVLPRQDGNQNGLIRRYEVYLSDDGRQWGRPVAKGEFPRDADWKIVDWDRPVRARFVRLVALVPWNNQPYASLARFELSLAE